MLLLILRYLVLKINTIIDFIIDFTVVLTNNNS